MSNRRLLAILAVLGVVILAGCASGVSPTETVANPSTETSSQSTPTSTSTESPNGNMSVHTLNVGQGSSTLIIGPDGDTILIDTGDWRDDGEEVIAYLEAQGVTRIDHLVTTHPDADHIGGHAAVIEHFETEHDGVGAVYDPGIASSSETYDEYLDAVEKHDVTLYRTQAGDSIPMNGASVQVLGPPEGYLADKDSNENSLVLHLQFGESSFLLPGDGETASEEYLVETYGDRLNSTVLAVGHHGSQSSTSESFLDAVAPKAGVISSAYDSQYGHPHEEVLTRLEAHSIPTYWTGTHGNVVFTSNGSAVTVATQESAPTTATNLNDEYVVFENTGSSSVDLSGWELADAADHTYTFPEGTVLEPGESITVHTGTGTDTETDLYWGQSSAVWNNDGDTVTLRDEAGDIVIEETY